MKKLANFVKRDNKGFTLVEIIVVLAILAILIAVALPSMTGILNDSKGKVLMQDARAAMIAYQIKRTDTPTAPISKTELATLIDKKADVGNLTFSVREKSIKTGTVVTSVEVTGFVYGDSKKVTDKFIGIKSAGGADDVASVYTSLTDAKAGVGEETADGTWVDLAD
ncbi:MAG: prepilin-type N-terminal cleavage/methylation domain-containing protein [Oscillospiraceae bacterium]